MEPADAEVGDPEPQRAESHEENRRERKRRRARGHIAVVTARDDDAREGGRQRGADHEHLQVLRIHLEQNAHHENRQRHDDELEERAHHGLTVYPDFDRRERYAGGEDGHRGVGPLDEVERRIKIFGPLQPAQHEDHRKDRGPGHRLLDGVEHGHPGIRFLAVSPVFLGGQRGVAGIEKRETDGNADGVHLYGHYGYHETD